MNFNFPSFSLPHFEMPHFVVLGNILTTIVAIFAIYFIFLISYATVRMFEIRKKEEEHLEHELEHYAKHQAHDESSAREAEERSRNPRWNKVLNLVFTENQADWKLSIIEADAMLDQLMTEMGFKGDNLGERLKSADRDTFPALTIAWEAHTVRNRIAHEGTGFELSSHEAKRIIALYESIFREFGFI